jgi:hypothetical protein
MKKLLSATFLLFTLLFSMSSYASIFLPPGTGRGPDYYNFDSTYFIVKIVNQSNEPISVVFDSGNWYSMTGSIAPNSLQNYIYTTSALSNIKENDYIVTSGKLTLVGDDGRSLCNGVWQHTVWGWLGQHDRFLLNMDNSRCDVSPKFDSSSNPDNGLHHNKSKDRDDTYTLTVR